MTASAVLALIDAAKPFVDIDPATLAQAVRRFGLEQLNAARADLRASIGDDRAAKLSAVAEVLGRLVAAGALEEPFVKAVLLDDASAIGLVRDLKSKAVNSAIAAGIKAGKKSPADLSEVRSAAAAQAANSGADENGRAPVARDDVDYHPPETPPPFPPSGDSASSETLASSFASSASSPPAPSTGVESESGKTLANEEDDDNGDDEPPDHDVSEETFRHCAALDHSDTDNGKRLIAYFGRDLLVRQEDDVPAGQLLAWTGTHWDLAGGAALAQLIGQKVGDLIKLEAKFLEFRPAEARAVTIGEAAARELKNLDLETDDVEVRARIRELTEQVKAAKKARSALSSRRANHRKWGVSSKNSAKVANMIKEASPHLRRHPDAFNSDPLKVATLTHTLTFVPIADPENPDPDGTRALVINGRTQYRLEAKRGHDRADMLTAVIPFKYDPNAPTREFDKFLDLFQPEPEKRRTVQQFSGMSLTAQPVQRVMFHTGSGGNGKSVYLEVLSRVLGDGLAVGIPAESVSGQVQNNPSAPTPDIARCYAKRHIRIAELPKDAPLKVETIKKLTGGERWPVRTMYKGYFEFKPTAKPHMSGNGEPKFDGADGGMRRRLIIVEWSVTLEESKHRDFEEVVSEIAAEGSGILNWLIAGAVDFLNKGLVLSEDVIQTTAEHFAEMDPCGQFADAHVRGDPGGPGVTARAMYLAYKAWCEVNGKSHMHETRFGRTMKKKFKRDDTKRVHVYIDVALHDVPQMAQATPDDSQADPRDAAGWGQGDQYI